MKRALILICALLPLASMAQPSGVYKTIPQNDGTREMTMKDVFLNRDLRPSDPYFSWETYLTPKEEVKKVAKGSMVRAHISKDYIIAENLKPAFPKGAANFTEASNGYWAYTLGNDLWIKNNNGDIRAIAKSEGSDIVYGHTVSRNEFGINGGIFWSPSGAKLAYYRKDESRVTSFPLLDIGSRTGSLMNIKYPMNGMDSELIDLMIYDLATGRSVKVEVDEFTPERYLTNVSWATDENSVFIQVVDRSQHHMKLNRYCATDGKLMNTLLSEDNDAWIEPLDPLYPIVGSDSYIYRTDNRDGWRNLYLCSPEGKLKRLTVMDADTEYVDNDGSWVYFYAFAPNPCEKQFFKVNIKNGKTIRLTPDSGWHKVSLSPDKKLFRDSWSAYDIPSVTQIRKSSDGKLVEQLSSAQNPLNDYFTPKISFGKVRSADNLFDNYYRIYYPKDFDPSKKYPVIVYVYGGPHIRLVDGSWLGAARYWELYMAQKGYIVYVQDNRGTNDQGAAYEKAINRQCGKAEMEDQMVGVEMLKSLPFVDKDRIGVHGWSYGGYMTISLITHYPESFKVAVAGGPVIDWKWYEIMYGERYMDTEETNPEGFSSTSLINQAKNLRGKLLICQGAIDQTVVWEHSLSFVQKCIEENVQLDYFPYPKTEHNVAGAWRVHLYDKVTNYFDDNL